MNQENREVLDKALEMCPKDMIVHSIDSYYQKHGVITQGQLFKLFDIMGKTQNNIYWQSINDEQKNK